MQAPLPTRSTSRLRRAWVLAGLLLGCGDDGSTGDGGTTAGDPTGGGMPIVGPAIVAMVDVERACAEPEATRVELRATRVGCVDPPPAPCTVPQVPRPIVGQGVDCLADSAPTQSLTVELTTAGRYAVELVTLVDESELSRVCYGVDGQAEVLFTEDQIASEATVWAEELDGSPCP